MSLVDKSNRFFSAVALELTRLYSSISRGFNHFSEKMKDFFYNSLLFWEQLAQKLDMWYDHLSNKLNQKAENVGNVAKPVFNTTYFFGEAAFAFYSTLQFLFSMAPLVLPLIAIINIPFFGEISSPLIYTGVIAISCLTGYFKYSSLQYQESQDAQIGINKDELKKLRSKFNKQKDLVKDLKSELEELKNLVNQPKNPPSTDDSIQPVENLKLRHSLRHHEVIQQSQAQETKASKRNRSNTV